MGSSSALLGLGRRARQCGRWKPSRRDGRLCLSAHVLYLYACNRGPRTSAMTARLPVATLTGRGVEGSPAGAASATNDEILWPPRPLAVGWRAAWPHRAANLPRRVRIGTTGFQRRHDGSGSGRFLCQLRSAVLHSAAQRGCPTPPSEMRSRWQQAEAEGERARASRATRRRT